MQNTHKTHTHGQRLFLLAFVHSKHFIAIPPTLASKCSGQAIHPSLCVHCWCPHTLDHNHPSWHSSPPWCLPQCQQQSCCQHQWEARMPLAVTVHADHTVYGFRQIQNSCTFFRRSYEDESPHDSFSEKHRWFCSHWNVNLDDCNPKCVGSNNEHTSLDGWPVHCTC